MVNKLKAKVNLHAFFIKDDWYEILNYDKSIIQNNYIILCRDNVNNVFFSGDIKHHRDDIPEIIQVHMYIWDYFHKPLVLLRKEKLLKINGL